ncbi:MAG TPA: hypothetical protein VHS31_04235 [Tepidisphaeraceae bacterium]|jgi:hypothetical protein|nr:hypothetical protein [Tepidisphaeraceae bacterium]
MTARSFDRSSHIDSRRGGFVLLIALAMFSVVSVAILALGLSMSADARRTFDRARRSQLDQLLLAGTDDARQHLSSPHAGDTWNTQLPHSLSEQAATLQSTIDPASDPGAGQLLLHIQARIENRSAEQIVRLAKNANGWGIVEARIPSE